MMRRISRAKQSRRAEWGQEFLAMRPREKAVKLDKDEIESLLLAIGIARISGQMSPQFPAGPLDTACSKLQLAKE
jgi:hypothetical protein